MFNNGPLHDMSDFGNWMSHDQKRVTFHADDLCKGSFIAMLKQAKRVQIEVKIYGSGRQVFEFATAGLDPGFLPAKETKRGKPAK